MKKLHSILSEKVEVSNKRISIAEGFELIERNNIILSYNSSIIDLSEVHEFSVKGIEVGKLLQFLLKKYDYSFIYQPYRKIIIQVKCKKRYDLLGYIKEICSGENLYGAVIICTDKENNQTIAVSSNNGFYSVKLAEGSYQLSIRHLGYAKESYELEIRGDIVKDFELKPITYEIEEVLVDSKEATGEFGEVSPMNHLSFNSSDVFAEYRILPGVIGTPANGKLQVNGGNDDENLILLDGIPINYSNHLNSLLSVFNGDAIKSISFHKSLFPTQFEGRLSSVTDIRIKEGNKSEHSQTLSLDMPAIGGVLEGPIIKNKLSYLISGRRSWLDFFDQLLSEENRLNYTFYDYNVKLAYDLNNNTNLQLMTYRSKDSYDTPWDNGNRVLVWDNELYSIRLNTLLSKKVSNTNSFAYTSYNNTAKADEIGFEVEDLLKSGIKEMSLTSEFNCNIDNMYRILFGVKGSLKKYHMISVEDSVRTREQYVSQFSLFYDNRIRINKRLYGQLGVNMVAYYPRNNRNYLSIQPRFSLKYSTQKEGVIYVGFSKMVQFDHHLKADIYPLPTDLRIPSIDKYKPKESFHFELGFKQFVNNGVFELSGLVKDRSNILGLKPETDLWAPNWANCIMVGKGRSYGVRFYQFRQWQKFILQFSYAYTKNIEMYPEIESNKKLVALTDIPHVFNIATTYNLTQQTSISIGGILKSGKIIQSEDGWEILPVDLFRKSRTPMNYRLDASYSYKKEFRNPSIKLLAKVGLYNIIGNPDYEEIADFYTVVYYKNLLPYASLTVKF